MNLRIKQIIEVFEEKKRKWGAQTRFAKRIGVSQGLVGDWISGKSKPNSEYRNRICEIYRINRTWLDNGNGPMVQDEANEPIEYQKQEEPLRSKVEEVRSSEYELGVRDGAIQTLRSEIEWYRNRMFEVLEAVEQKLSIPSKQLPATPPPKGKDTLGLDVNSRTNRRGDYFKPK
jgi:transcriptional regulator with XRE-family HTH domain